MVYFLYLNCVQLVFLLVIVTLTIFATLVNLFEKQLPALIVQVIRYGKISDENAKSPLIVQVPKSWFKHFYIYSSIISSIALYMCISNYIYGVAPPDWIYDVLDYSLGNLRKPTVNATRTLLAISLLTLQCVRRLYDTQFVSVFGKNAKMNIGHYVLGLLHYSACVSTILGGGPNFSKLYATKPILQWTDLNVKDFIATYLFLWAWWHQYKVTVILANLRTDDKGNVITQSYRLPKGDWFDYISSPHNFAEILMYSSLTLILWPNFTWWFIYVWVVANQVEVALLSHRWYKEKFEDYPKNRKILFPCIY